MEPGGQGIKVHSGALSGQLSPRLALDSERGACSLPTPIAQFKDVSYSNADITIYSQDMNFRVKANASSLEAQNGSDRGRTNYLSGSITIDGEAASIPVAGSDPVLDPNYDAESFAQSFSCTNGLQLIDDNAQCSLDETVAKGIARLIIQSVGTVASAVNEDDDCGFESNLTDPDQVVGSPGQIGMIAWSIARCVITRALRRLHQPASTDCRQRHFL